MEPKHLAANVMRATVSLRHGLTQMDTVYWPSKLDIRYSLFDTCPAVRVLGNPASDGTDSIFKTCPSCHAVENLTTKDAEEREEMK